MALPGLVHSPHPISSAYGQSQRGKPKEPARPAPAPPTPPVPAPAAGAAAALPAAVAEMREAILAAVRSGHIEDLRTAIEWNELKPDFGMTNAEDGIAFLKQQSGDGEGREVLAILGNLLEGAHAVVPLGRDIENNRVFVWPAVAEAPMAKLTPAQEVELLRLVPAAQAQQMKAKGKYAFWRLMIAADGTWHSFKKAD